MALKPWRNPDARPLGSTFSTDVHAAVLEFIGTFFFLLFAFGATQSALYSDVIAGAQAGRHGGAIYPTYSVVSLLYISTAFGLSLLVCIWMFYRATGGIFNPNVTTALLLVGAIGPVRWILCCIAQMVGAIAAAGAILALMPGPVTFNTFPGAGVNKAQAVFMEMFATAALVLSVLMLTAERHYAHANSARPFAPIGIGLTLFVGMLWTTVWTGGSLNTARSFGPAVVTGFPRSNHWIYWIGPLAGSLLAAALYHFLRRIPYWTDQYPTGPGANGPAMANGPGMNTVGHTNGAYPAGTAGTGRGAAPLAAENYGATGGPPTMGGTNAV